MQLCDGDAHADHAAAHHHEPMPRLLTQPTMPTPTVPDRFTDNTAAELATANHELATAQHELATAHHHLAHELTLTTAELAPIHAATSPAVVTLVGALVVAGLLATRAAELHRLHRARSTPAGGDPRDRAWARYRLACARSPALDLTARIGKLVALVALAALIMATAAALTGWGVWSAMLWALDHIVHETPKHMPHP